MKKCLNCGFENDDNAKFCSQCGAALPEADLQDKNTYPGKDQCARQESDPECNADSLSEEKDTEEQDSQHSEINETDPAQDLGKEKSPDPDIRIEASQILADESKKTHTDKKKKVILKIIGACVGVIIVICAIAFFSMPKLESIEASYDGDTKAGTVLDSSNDGFTVTGNYSDGDSKKVTGWKIEEPEKLKADKTSKVKIKYHGAETVVKVTCSTSKIESISAYYDGDTESGTIIDDNNNGIHVNAEYKNGKVKSVENGWTVKEPCTLEADKSYNVIVEYKGFTSDVYITCSTSELTGISARYTGKTDEGVILDDDNKGIVVTAEYKDGSEEEVSGWTIEKDKELKAGKTSKVKISYEGQTCTLKVVCSTMSEDQYKEKCSSISYKDLARDPSGNTGKYYKFTGEVFQVIEGTSYIGLMVNVTRSQYGTYDDSIFVYYSYKDGEKKILEDDIVTIYGQSIGDYSYTTVMGAERTIPGILAKYIDVK